MGCVVLGRLKKNAFYKYIDFKKHGFWVGKRLDSTNPNEYYAYYYRLGVLGNRIIASSWGDAVIIAIIRLTRNEEHYRAKAKKNENKMA